LRRCSPIGALGVRVLSRICRVLVLSVLASAAAWAQPRQAVLHAATPNEAIYAQGLAELRRRTGGLLTVESRGPQTSAQVLAALRRGEIELGIVPLSALKEVAPGFGVFDLAFGIPDVQSMMLFSQELAARPLSEELARQGLGSLGVWYGGALVIAASRPLRSPADFEGSRLAIRADAVAARPFAAVGVALSSPGPANLPSALQRGAVDAAELTWTEVQTLASALRYVTETNHRFIGHAVVYHRARFESLPAATRTLLRNALREVTREVSQQVAGRERAAHQKALDTPGLTVLAVDDRLRAEWREAMAAAQADDIRRIDPELVQMAHVRQRQASAARSATAFGLTWNAWFQVSQQAPARDLTVGTAYEFKLDLARLGYPGVMSSYAEARVMAEIERQREAGEVTLLVRPILMGGALRPLAGTDFGARPLRIRTDRLSPTVRDAQTREAYMRGQLSLQQLAAELSVGEPLAWSLVAREAGCARIALSIWDPLGLRPLDYLVVTQGVRRAGEREPACPEGLQGGALVSGLHALLDIDPAGAAAGTRRADAALHLFDVERAGEERPGTIGVYVDRAEFEAAAAAGRTPAVHAWELDSRLSDFLSQPTKLQDSLSGVRASLGRVERPYADVVRQLDAALFGARTADDQAAADAARQAMQRLAQQGQAPQMLVRYVNDFGQLYYVPLALLAADAPSRVLARRITVVQPLPGASRTAAGNCFDAWNLAIPRRLDGVRADDAELLRRDDWRVTGDRLAWYEDNLALLRFLSSPAQAGKTGEALVLLAHHGDGKLTYSATARPDRILDEELRRNFGPGSVAVLAACSTAGISDASRAFVQKLMRRGVEAFVVSPFQVDASFGTHLAVSFVDVAGEARRRGETPRIVDLYERALQKTIDSFAGQPGYGDMALEFQLIGNHELRLCAPPR
jgi:C4-dicarboxylate-binding protein DctP